jgi:hypothetical protein
VPRVVGDRAHVTERQLNKNLTAPTCENISDDVLSSDA